MADQLNTFDNWRKSRPVFPWRQIFLGALVPIAIFYSLPTRALHLSEPEDPKKYTAKFDQFYSSYAGLYYYFVKLFPVWRRWIRQALPYCQGSRILEVSFGTGYLLNLYVD